MRPGWGRGGGPRPGRTPKPRLGVRGPGAGVALPRALGSGVPRPPHPPLSPERTLPAGVGVGRRRAPHRVGPSALCAQPAGASPGDPASSHKETPPQGPGNRCPPLPTPPCSCPPEPSRPPPSPPFPQNKGAGSLLPSRHRTPGLAASPAPETIPHHLPVCSPPTPGLHPSFQQPGRNRFDFAFFFLPPLSPPQFSLSLSPFPSLSFLLEER